MIDIDLFKKILESKDEGYITNGDFIPFELFELMSKYNEGKINILFVKQPKSEMNGKNYYTYDVEIKCQSCGKMFVKNMTRTSLLSLIKKYKGDGVKKDLYCKECSEKYELERQNYFLEQQKKAEESNKERLKDYIQVYLNPHCSWNKNISLWEKIMKLQNDVNRNVIAEHILQMPYKDFLQTPYWKAISQKVMKKANYKCQLCNSNENLNVHHRTYEHHGYELYHINDLICLCQDCHEIHHDI